MVELDDSKLALLSLSLSRLLAVKKKVLLCTHPTSLSVYLPLPSHFLNPNPNEQEQQARKQPHQSPALALHLKLPVIPLLPPSPHNLISSSSEVPSSSHRNQHSSSDDVPEQGRGRVRRRAVGGVVGRRRDGEGGIVLSVSEWFCSRRGEGREERGEGGE